MATLGGLGEVGKVPELKRKVLFTLAMLAVYRLGVFVSTPGIDVTALRDTLGAGDGNLFDWINMFSGGSLENFSIFTLGIMPYISVSIIMQILTPTIPALEALKKEGEAGRRIITRYTRQGTILLALVQSCMIALGLEGQGLLVSGVGGFQFVFTTMMTLTAGTAFIMWLGEQITEKGIGNGISIIIFAGIVARMPQVLYGTIELSRSGEINPLSILLIFAFCLASIFGIVFVERSHRRIPVQYPRRMVGKNVAQAQTQYLPLKVNMAGVIPPIFASALLVVPGTFVQFSGIERAKELFQYIQPGSVGYTVLFAGLIIAFCFFYTALIYNPVEVAENLKKQGGFIPTVRPGQQTAEYLYKVLNRLTLWGAIYICIVCLLPQYVYFGLGAEAFAFVFGGTSVLIVVGVTLDTASQIESIVVARNYESFMSRSAKAKSGPGAMVQARGRVFRR